MPMTRRGGGREMQFGDALLSLTSLRNSSLKAGLTHLVTHSLCTYKPNCLCQRQGVHGESHQPGRLCSWVHRGLHVLSQEQNVALCLQQVMVQDLCSHVYFGEDQGLACWEKLLEDADLFIFPTISWKQFPHWHMRYGRACSYIRVLSQTGGAENRANRQRKMHGNMRGKNSEITYLQGCTVQEQTYNLYSIFSWKTIK